MTDGRTDGRTDGGDCNIPIAFLKKRGDNQCHKLLLLPQNDEKKTLLGCMVILFCP